MKALWGSSGAGSPCGRSFSLAVRHTSSVIVCGGGALSCFQALPSCTAAAALYSLLAVSGLSPPSAGAPTRISLTQVGGGAQWRWQLGSQPRLSSSDRPSPENALQSWIDRHLQTLHVDSQQALQDLQGQWRTQGLPHPHPQHEVQEAQPRIEGEEARPPPRESQEIGVDSVESWEEEPRERERERRG